jgi:hypothetical protein
VAAGVTERILVSGMTVRVLAGAAVVDVVEVEEVVVGVEVEVMDTIGPSARAGPGATPASSAAAITTVRADIARRPAILRVLTSSGP